MRAYAQKVADYARINDGHYRRSSHRLKRLMMKRLRRQNKREIATQS